MLSVMASSVMASTHGIRLPADRAPRMQRGRYGASGGRGGSALVGMTSTHVVCGSRACRKRVAAAVASIGCYTRWMRGEGERESSAVREQQKDAACGMARGIRESRCARREMASSSVPRGALMIVARIHGAQRECERERQIDR